MEDILLIGFGGHCKSIIDSIENVGTYKIYGIIDIKEKMGQSYKGYKVIGTDDDLQYFYNKGIRNVFICIGFIGNNNIRNIIYKKIKKIGFNIPNIIDKTAILASNVKLGEGIFVGKRAILNSDVEIDNMAIINTGAIVEHESYVGRFSHISIGTILCGNVNIKENVFIGANSTVIHGIEINKNSIIGAGSTVIKNVLENSKCYGVVK
ncbi:NeuD/PglB/VioB family sugar acetyltransferase [uncultured Tyzzerella sp.]|uniref:NeuD/PglB/VioB family sugar acetyltransferase n=1 Tax=uncultured Tyzzerella sp. TaxID=2321398 RepID=UPI00294231D0|nr:NeuD/PglB/VioB family sugar acetyltransferase [uncultured Tyzzerella sp.]